MKSFFGRKSAIRILVLAAVFGLWQQPLFAAGFGIAWTREFGETNIHENIRGMALGGNGNVYVMGDNQNNYVTAAYNSDGNFLWSHEYNGPSNGYDTPLAIVSDDDGNVYVTGDSDGGFAMTVAYAGNGSPLWTNLSGGFGLAITVDYSHRVFVAGGLASYWVGAYTNGVGLWAKPSPTLTGTGRAVATDNAGHVFVTGDSGNDFQTAAYNAANGTLLWSKSYNGKGNSEDLPCGIAVGGNGNVYVTGLSPGVGTAYDIVTIAYSSGGVPLWTNIYNGSANGNDTPRAITVGPEGNVYVVGQSSEAVQSWVVLAYSSTGTPLWTRLVGSAGANGVATDGCGNVYVSGGVSGGASSGFTVAAYTSTGVPLWSNTTNAPGSSGALYVAVNSVGAVFAAGSTWRDNPVYPYVGGNDFLTAKYISGAVANSPSPSTLTVPDGSPVTFTANPCGTQPFAYQWKKNGVNIQGATNATLTFNSVLVSDAGNYSVVVTNSAGADTSALAVLTVIERPVLIVQPWSSVSGFSFSFAGHSNTLYRVDVSTNLSHWDPLGFAASFSDTIIYNDAQSKNYPFRFYRVTRP
jgi:outer membrane protein assembly factor BamB